jgi:nucleoside triphosphate pyrophosphatase
MRLVLASTSRIRAELLTRAGLTFEALRPDVDENTLKASAKDLSPGDLAQSLARAKAISIAKRFPDAMVIGADQVLNLEGRSFDKPESREAARGHLLQLRGRSHVLETAICCARDGTPLFHHLGRATLTMRSFSDSFLDDYLERTGADVLTSVGAYKLEGLGAQLFESIEGDYFTILGLPLLPLLDFLRRQGALAT